MSNNDKEKITESGREVIIVPDAAFQKVECLTDYSGKEIGTFDVVLREYSENFKYKFVSDKDLKENEKKLLSKKSDVFLYYGDTKYSNRILISENINEMISGDTLGAYDYNLDKIILKRSVLSNPNKFFEVLFHELAHATSKYQDNTREFENELGKIIGILSSKLILCDVEINKDDKNNADDLASFKSMDFANQKITNKKIESKEPDRCNSKRSKMHSILERLK